VFAGFGLMGNAPGVIKAIDKSNRLRLLIGEIAFPYQEETLLIFNDLELFRQSVIKGLEIFYSDCANELGRYCAKNSLF
jgi:hypothetical protein